MTTYTLKNTDRFLEDVAASLGKQYILKIKDMPAEDKPREKLLKYGPTNLSLAELMAIVLGTGTKKEEVLAMASRVLKEYGQHSLGGKMDAAVMSKELDIPIVKALQIVACAELGKRFFQKKETGPAIVRTAKSVSAYVGDMHNLSKEHLRGIYLNAHYRVVHDEVITIGTVNANIVHPREIFKPAIECSAVAVILVHNHPSGNLKPSQADIEITRQVVAAGKVIGIPLIDHVIVSKGKFISVDVSYE